ncbi:efflux transporter outer membrane subunit [Pseudomonas sp. MAFF 301449]|uniref:Efflux transporter outer membrane subunit n=1 Tax=Pseudomonas cyclaminis TaxID=2781239 RepID=A0ABR9SNE5_9PSED|nr:efflux transporter outer membrane subunit [Pseudomonas cyclaminis]MBE8590362.1 efflux transporter outer membrane subunit [Pseudomonas cyclaminis]MBE8602349.1 efflux transporter outer membrane subunit [Pseudomonas cyclaminis]
MKSTSTQVTTYSAPLLTARRFLSFALALLLSGCSFGDLKPHSQLMQPDDVGETLASDGMKLSPATWPTQNWWSSYRDPQLDDLVHEALADSPTLLSAAARVHQAGALEAVEGAQLLPSLSAAISVTRERFSSNGTTPDPARGTWQRVHQGTLSVGYELDFWGKNRSAVEAAIGRRRALEVDEQATTLILSSTIVQTYIALQNTYEQIDVAQALLQQQEQIEELTKKRFIAELGTEIDIKQSQASLPATRAYIAALREAVELNQNKLASLLGKGPDRGRSISRPRLQPSDTFMMPTNIPAELIGHRPDVVAQRWRVEASHHEIEVAKARFYPDVNLSAFIGMQSLALATFNDHSSRILGVAPAISLPIFEGGRLRGNLDAQDAAYDLAVENYNQTVINALRDIADQLSSLRWLKERLSQQVEAVATAEAAADLVNKRYAAGLATYLQVLTTQNATLAERRQLVDLQSRALSLQANLSRALGGGYLPEMPKPADNSSVADNS